MYMTDGWVELKENVTAGRAGAGGVCNDMIDEDDNEVKMNCDEVISDMYDEPCYVMLCCDGVMSIREYLVLAERPW